MKKIVSYKIEEKVLNNFNITCKILGLSYSETLEHLMKNYIIKNKVDINEYITKFWNGEIKE